MAELTLAEPDAVFGRRLRSIRQQAGMTQRQLAEGMTLVGHRMVPSAISKIESGDRPISLSEAACLAGLLGVTVAALAGDAPAADGDLIAARIAVKALRDELAGYDTAASRIRDARRSAEARLRKAEARLAALMAVSATVERKAAE